MHIMTSARAWATLTAAGMAATAGLLAGGTPASAGAGSAQLFAGQSLTAGQQLVSQAGYIAVMQGDGNFVEYAPGHLTVWATGTNGHPGSDLEMQSDGNLVVYAPGHVAIWSSRTSGQPGSELVLGSGLDPNHNSGLGIFAPTDRLIWER